MNKDTTGTGCALAVVLGLVVWVAFFALVGRVRA